MANFSEDFNPSIAPPVLADENGANYLGVSLSLGSDAMAEILQLAIRLSFGTVEQPDDALYKAGTNRGLIWAPGESKSSFQARVQDAWATWAIAGTAKSITDVLALIGFTNAQVVPDPTWASAWSLTFTTGNHPGVTADVVWDFPGIFWDDTVTSWDSGVEPWRTEILRWIICKLKAAHETMTHLKLEYDGLVWDQPGLLWDQLGATWDQNVPGYITVKPYPGFQLPT